jgi:hypothetical protein
MRHSGDGECFDDDEDVPVHGFDSVHHVLGSEFILRRRFDLLATRPLVAEALTWGHATVGSTIRHSSPVARIRWYLVGRIRPQGPRGFPIGQRSVEVFLR